LTPVNIQPAAEVEAGEAAAGYEAEQPGLGIEFLLELDAAMERAVENPLACVPVFLEARRVLWQSRVRRQRMTIACSERLVSYALCMRKGRASPWRAGDREP
jgi:hypothetical protein